MAREGTLESTELSLARNAGSIRPTPQNAKAVCVRENTLRYWICIKRSVKIRHPVNTGSVYSAKGQRITFNRLQADNCRRVLSVGPEPD